MAEAGTDGPAVFLASQNRKKLEELQRILAPLVPGIRVVGLDDVAPYPEPVEDQPDFAGNALLKARAGVAATGLPALADDSGLCVDALNGMPGVLSARWSGPADLHAVVGETPAAVGGGGRATQDQRNNALLLAQLADVPDERRGAHFVCAVAFCLPDGTEHVVDGRMDGRIIREPRGSGGFGYDVVFCAEGHDVTTAELSQVEKDAVSHRGKALTAVAPLVAAALRGG